MSERKNVWSLELSSAQQELLKWLAIVSMTFDHVNKILFRGDLAGFSEFGRLAFPLFCYLIAYNVVRRNAAPERYFLALLIFGGLSQSSYGWAFNSAKLNIFFTLFLGTVYVWLVPWLEARGRRPLIAHITTIGALLVPATLVSYDVSGVFLVPVLAGFLRKPSFVLVPALALYLMLTNDFLPISIYTLLLLPAMFIVPKLPLGLGRSSKWLFYTFYPLHLLVLASLRNFLS